MMCRCLCVRRRDSICFFAGVVLLCTAAVNECDRVSVYGSTGQDWAAVYFVAEYCHVITCNIREYGNVRLLLWVVVDGNENVCIYVTGDQVCVVAYLSHCRVCLAKFGANIWVRKFVCLLWPIDIRGLSSFLFIVAAMQLALYRPS
jgi:hypothetical protein